VLDPFQCNNGDNTQLETNTLIIKQHGFNWQTKIVKRSILQRKFPFSSRLKPENYIITINILAVTSVRMFITLTINICWIFTQGTLWYNSQNFIDCKLINYFDYYLILVYVFNYCNQTVHCYNKLDMYA